jgi:thioesterase domain-containing protein
VAHSHFGLLHQIRRHTNVLRIGVEDRVTMLGSVSAAQANTQLYVALLNGAALFPRDLKRDGLADLAAWLTRERITYYRSSASTFRHWAKHLSASERCPTLRLLAIGGEPVYRHDFELYRSHFLPDCLLVNALSTTETGTIRIHLLDRNTRFEGHIVPAGYPVDDTDVFLVNEAGVEVGAGEIGEIAVRSRGLAAGYWGQETLTRTKFLSHPDDGRLRTYRTGDLGQMSADGALVQLGRRDSLLKISGHRIDIGEVETALRESDMVRQVAVVDREDPQGEKRLVAYVVSNGEPPPNRAALRRFLKDRLPEYMVPSGFQLVDALPLTPSGKIDRQALPPLAPSTPSGASVGHLGLLGTQLRVIWEDLLDLTGVGPHDDFMDLGGDSLLGIEMLLRIDKVCGRTLAPSRLLGGAITIDRLVHLLLEDGQAHFGRPLTAVQAGGARRPLFFLHGDHENGGLYCHDLARSLSPDQPFYAVTPHGLDGDELPWSIETMASDRVSAVRAVQPTGPYRLGGYCTGGIIAFEMARQLEAQGERVETLLLIDAALENASLPFRMLGRASRRLAAGLRWSEVTRRQIHLRLRPALQAYAESARSGAGGRVRFLANALRSLRRRLGATAKGGADTGEIGADISAYVTRHLAYGARRRDYVPGRFTGRIALFRSDYLLDKPPGGSTAGWHHVAAGVDVHWLPGTHQSAVTQHVAVVAEKMKAYLG